jgi:Putative zinc-finger
VTEYDSPAVGDGRPAEGGCPELAPGLVTAYARGEVSGAAAWSVEAHVPGCEACRATLAGGGQRDRLAANRSVLLARLGLPPADPVARALRRCGVPEHVPAILAATPSLRRSWLTGVLLALAAAVGAAYLLRSGAPVPGMIIRAGGGGPRGAWAGLVPFLVLAPMLPLAAVAAAFSARLDPATDLATAAPVSGVWLLCVRAVAVIGATLLPTVLAALALPGPWWLPAAVLLPALAVSAAALAASSVAGPVPGAIGAGLGWVAAVVAAGVVTGSPAPVLGPAGQLAALAVVIGAAAMVAARRQRIDFGRTG